MCLCQGLSPANTASFVKFSIYIYTGLCPGYTKIQFLPAINVKFICKNRSLSLLLID